MYVFMGKPEYLPFISCRHVQLTLQYGLSVLSASGFSLYAVFLLAACGDSNNAYKYSSLGMQIIQKYKSKEWAPRVKCSFYGMISIWREPCSSSLQPLKEVYELGQKTGDFEVRWVDSIVNIFVDRIGLTANLPALYLVCCYGFVPIRHQR